MLNVISRRNFLKQSSVVTASLLMPEFLHGFSATSVSGKVLVVVQLSGGNDALNTVIDINNDDYYRSRQKISVPKNEVLLLNDEAGLHPAMKGLHRLFKEGNVAIVNSVGYPHPDLSHFRAMDIWQTASGSDEYLSNGWLGRYLDCCARMSHSAVETDDTLSLALKGKEFSGFAVKNPARLYKTIAQGYYADISKAAHDFDHAGGEVSYLYKTLSDTIQSAGYIYKNSLLYKSTAIYPQGEFANGLKTIAGLIIAGCSTSVYYISLSGFDTHIQQPLRHAKILAELSDGLAAFTGELKKNNKLKDVLIMTFSEFGRRVKENASGGTDHGKAGNMFFITDDQLKKGIVNDLPDLTTTDNGDVAYDVDFRNVYATVLEKWLGADSEKILGKKFALLDFIK